MIVLGDAEKTFSELTSNDFIYYIDPKKPMDIQDLKLKSVNPFEGNPGWVKLEYFQSSQALDLGAHIDTVPTKLLVAKANAKHIITLSMPPTVYFTNKKALQKFMGNDLKKKR